MVDFFFADNLAHVRATLGATEADIKSAVKTAERKALTWARREAKKGLAAAAGIPYRAATIRTKKRGKSVIWFGLNPVSGKYLAASARKKGVFTHSKLGGHPFTRKGKARLPIVKDEAEIEPEAESFIENELAPKVADKLVTEFLAAMDNQKGREAGSSAALLKI